MCDKCGDTGKIREEGYGLKLVKLCSCNAGKIKGIRRQFPNAIIVEAKQPNSTGNCSPAIGEVMAENVYRQILAFIKGKEGTLIFIPKEEE